MKIKLFVQLVLTGAVLISCKKDGDVKGTLVNSVSGKPIPGVTVNVDAINSGFASEKDGVSHLNSGTTGSDGSFSIPFKFKENKRSLYHTYIDVSYTTMDTSAARDEKYILNNGFLDKNIVPYLGSISYPDCNSSASSTTHPPKNLDFRIMPLTRVKLKLVNGGSFNVLNISLYDENFSLNLNIQHSYDFMYALKNYLQVPSNGKIYVKYNFNNSSFVRYDTIKVEPFGKVTYVIN